MKKISIFQNEDEKKNFTSQVNDSNSLRVKFFAPLQIVIILYELIKDIRKFIINPNEFANLITIPVFKINISYHEAFGIIEAFIILISIAIILINHFYKKYKVRFGKLFHSSITIYSTLLLFSSVAAILIDAYVTHEADFTFFYFILLVITSLFYLPPLIVIPEILISDIFLWSLISVFNWDSVFSPYKPYCVFLMLGLCLCLLFRAHYRLNALRREEKIKELEMEAEHRDKLKSMFLANMSHEIRTPMNAIVGMSELALDYNLDDSQKNNLRQIHSSALSLLAIINDILDFSKIESGKMEICNVDFDLFKTVYDVTNVAKVKIAGKKVQLIVEINPELKVSYNGDDIRLRQILINLIGNAAKFTNEGYIIIRIEDLKKYEDKEGLRFNIIDSGQGIKPEDLKKLFNAFQQVDMKANRTKEGSGLGLSISKNLVQLMGGNISVKSEYGKGSCFYFDLPIKGVTSEKCGEKYKAIFDKSEVNQYHSELRNLPVEDLLNKGEFAYLFAEKSEDAAFVCPDARILVVDDNEVNLQVAEGLLNKLGIKPQTAPSGFDALKIIEQQDFDIIFMDHQMPVMDGVETLQKLRKWEDSAEKHSVVVALSANAVNGAAEMFLENGFEDFLSKPVTGKDFARCLKKWLNPELIKETSDKMAEAANEYSLPEDFVKPAADKIDLPSALEFSGSFENWLSATKTFYKEIEKQSSAIESFLAAKDYKNFTIAVHALKSSARIIGAGELSKRAKELEALGNTFQARVDDGAIGEEISQKTKVLLELYKSYSEVLQSSVLYKKEQSPVQKTTEAQISQLLQELKSAAEDNNLTDSEECIKKLSLLELPDSLATQFPLLQEAVDNIDFEKLVELIRL